MHIYNEKFDVFLEVVKLLNSKLGVVPVLCGSLGLYRAIGEPKYIDDIDIVVPEQYAHTSSGWEEVIGLMGGVGFEQVLGENNFRRGDCVVSIGCEWHDLCQEFQRFGIDVRELVSSNIDGAYFKEILPEHFVRWHV